MRDRILLGSHMSVRGGIFTAFERGTATGCSTMQVFVKNSNQWVGKPLTPEDIGNYKTAEAKASIAPVVAHAAYLINLCAVDRGVLRRSRVALEDELRRCEALGIAGLIVHPGAHMGAGLDAGIAGIAESINAVHKRTPGFRTRTILETTAGQGTTVGSRLEELSAIIEQIEDPSRAAICIDTCHLFAAGYPINTQEGWESTMRLVDNIIGIERLVVIHVNDSKKGLGSRVDRHDHIGKGLLGVTCFRNLMNDPRLTAVPKILETEKSEDMHEDIENMSILRSFLSAPPPTVAC